MSIAIFGSYVLMRRHRAQDVLVKRPAVARLRILELLREMAAASARLVGLLDGQLRQRCSRGP